MRGYEKLVLSSLGLIVVILSNLGFELTGQEYYILFAVSGVMLAIGPELKHRFGSTGPSDKEADR